MGNLVKIEGGEWILPKDTYRAIVHVTKDYNGTFHALVAQLPGTSGSGLTLPAALTNVQAAAKQILRNYRAAGKSLPWVDEPTKPFGAWRGAVFVCLDEETKDSPPICPVR